MFSVVSVYTKHVYMFNENREVEVMDQHTTLFLKPNNKKLFKARIRLFKTQAAPQTKPSNKCVDMVHAPNKKGES